MSSWTWDAYTRVAQCRVCRRSAFEIGSADAAGTWFAVHASRHHKPQQHATVLPLTRKEPR